MCSRRVEGLLSFVSLCVLLTLLAATRSPLFAQDLPPSTAMDQMGQQAFQSYHGGDIDQIGLANGTLSLNQELLSYSQRGALQLSFNIFYTNQPQHFALWCIPDPTPTNPNQQTCSDSWGYTNAFSPLPREKGDVFVGWAQETALTSLDVDVTFNSGKSDQHTDHYANWSLQTADGAKHPLGNLGSLTWQATPSDSYSTQTGPFETLDATQWRVNGSLTTDANNTNTIIAPDGVVGGTQDANGNIIMPTATGLTDTLGRQIPLPPTYKSASNTDTSGCPQPPQVLLPVAFAVLWNVPDPNRVNEPYKFCYATVPLNIPRLGAVPPFADAQSPTKLQSIVLPDGHTWSFEYNDPNDGSGVNYGTLTKITLPTGGTIAYTYATTSADHLTCQNGGRWVTSRTVDANDGTGPHKWTYSYQITDGTNSTTLTATVTDPLGNYTVHTFNSLYASDECPAYEAQTLYFQKGGALLKSTSTTYSFIAGSNSTGPLNVVPKTITTTWPNGKTETVTRAYDTGFNYLSFKGGSPINAVYGKVASEAQSDYGQAAAGPTVRTISISYKAFSDSNYLAANMFDLVSSKTVSDAAGCKQAETDHVYDEPNYLTGYPSALPPGTHGGPPNGVRGNLTTTTEQLFPANSCPTTAQAGPTSHTNWYDTGEIYQSVDPLSHTTTHTYDSSVGGAYPTQTCNALNQCVHGLYDFNTGLLTSFTDANSQTTTLAYDSMRRVTKITQPADPAGNHPFTNFNYPDANTVERLQTITAALNDDSFAFFDGLGRRNKTTHATPAGTATTVTTFDLDGRTASVTNPYFSTSDPTYGVTQTLYDGLGRVTQTTKQDGSTVSVQYNQPATALGNADCTVTTDELLNQRKSCTDALGRLVEVDEPGDAFSGTAATGSIAIGAIQQNTQTTPASSGTGQFTVSGAEGSDITCSFGRCKTIWDTGTITVTIGGFTSTGRASQLASSASIALALANGFNVSGSPVTASASGSTVTVAAVASGPQVMTMSYGGTSYSFDAAGSTTVSGGQNAVGVTYTDAGTVTASVNGGFSTTVCYGQSTNAFCSGKPVNSTTDQVGNALAAALSAAGSPVSASYNGGSLSISYGAPSFAGNVPVSLSSAPDNAGMFPGGSFSGATTLSGGADPYPSGIAHPFTTLYSYDVLGNLLRVEQHGDAADSSQWRVRTFTYNSLSQLLTAQNPESGKITYSYDADGNLLQKTSPAPNQTGTAAQTISYCYDGLHRLIGKAYAAVSCPLTSPAVSYAYDSGANAIGHMTSLTDQAGSGSYSFDALGRIASETRLISGVSKSMSYGYNLDGSVATLKYPSGSTVTYTPWQNGSAIVSSPSDAKDTANNINYATGATYGADGSLAGFLSGQSTSFAGITNTFTYNKRLQPVNMDAALPSAAKVFSLTYDFHAGAGDNGNVWGIANNRDTTRSQSFTYDTLNRLTSAQNAGTNCAATTVNGKTEYWGNSYGYDAWGNLTNKTITKCGAENFSVAALANNQLSGYGYDAAGNMTRDLTSGLTYSYDQENRITGANGYNYTYDADGNRVMKSNETTGTLYWYMTPGIIAESDLSGNLKSEYVFFNGERIARRDFGSPGGGLLLLLRPPEDRLGDHRLRRQHQGRFRLLSVGRRTAIPRERFQPLQIHRQRT